MSSNSTLRRAWSIVPFAAAALAGLGAAGCEATFRPTEPIGFTYDDGGVLVRARFVPPDVWSYPRVLYGGTYAYFVDGLWYMPTPNGWMVFRREPIELSRERTRLGHGRSRAPYGFPR